MEEYYDEVKKMCKLCLISIGSGRKFDFQKHYSKSHNPKNLEVCDVTGCTYRFDNIMSLYRHKTVVHGQPACNASLPDNKKMVWAEKLRCVYGGVVGLFVGVSKAYHPRTAASHRDSVHSKCIVTKDFESEGLCFLDHSSARKLFTVTVKRKKHQTDEEFKKWVNEASVGFKMYARQFFVNSIYSNYRSEYELMDKEKDAVHAKLRQSAFSEYYSDEPKQSLTYYDWKKTVIGQPAVAAAAKENGVKPLRKRKVETITSGAPVALSSPSKRRVMGNPPNEILQAVKNFGRPAIREWLDKLSQEEKASQIGSN